MKKFGIYTFSFKKSNPVTGIKAINGERGMFMIGEVELTASKYEGKSLKEACEIRISEEFQSKNGTEFYSLNDISNVRYYKCEGEEDHQDTKFRKYLANKGYKLFKTNNSKNTEIVEDITIDEIYNYFSAWRDNDLNITRDKDYQLRSYQKEVVDKSIDVLNGNNRVLINLSTRGGKSFVALSIAKYFTLNNILILTPFPCAQQSFKEVVEDHVLYTDWKFCDKFNVSEKDYNQIRKNVFLLSFQIFDKNKAKIKKLLKDINFDVVIVDETHRQSVSERSQKILELVNHNKEIHLSGTPFNDIKSNRFNENEIVTLDFINLLERDKQENCVGFPELNIYNVCNMMQLNNELIKMFPDMFDYDAQFNLNKVFCEGKNALDKATDILRFMLEPRTGRYYSSNSKNILDSHNHILMFVPSVAAVNSVYKALNNLKNIIPGLNEYEVMIPYSNDDNNIDLSNVESEINEFQNNNKKTFIISCNKLTTGVTLSKCDCILLCKSINSAESYVQTIFRCMTSEPGKKVADVYNYDSECILKVIDEIVKIKTKSDNITNRAAIDKFLNVVNLYELSDMSSFNWKQEDCEYYLSKVKNIRAKYNPEYVFTVKLPNSIINKYYDDINLLNTVNINKSIVVATGEGGNKRMNIKSTNNNVSTINNQKIDDEKIQKKLMSLVSHIDWYIINNFIIDSSDFNRLINIRPQINNVDINDSLFEVYKQYLLINKENVCEYIEDLNA